MFIDSHCHLDRLKLEEFDGQLDNVISNAMSAKVNRMLCVSVTLEDFPAMVEKTNKYDDVFLSCGTHPLNQEDKVDEVLLDKLSEHQRVIAIGETGLDYFYAPETKELQLDSFKKHVRVARKHKKPLIIHTRDAREDTINLLKEHKLPSTKGVLHCFTESLEMAKAAIELGLYISISGIVTFKTATELQQVVKALPLDRLLIETDSPWLAPVPYRGKKNQPGYVVEVAEFIAELKGISVDELARITTDNFYTLFDKVARV